MLQKATIANEQDSSSEALDKPPKFGLLTNFLRWIVQFVLMVAVVGAAIAFMSRAMDRVPATPAPKFEPKPLSVNAQRIVLTNYQPTFLSYGKIIAGNSLEIKAPVAGKIVGMANDLQVGTSVEQGALLIEIDDFVYQGAVLEAKADIAQTEATLTESSLRLASEQAQLQGAIEQAEIARTDLERAKTLIKQGAVTQKQIGERELILSQRQLAVDQRRNNIEIEGAKQAQQQAALDRLKWRLERAERSLLDTKIISPINGRLSLVNADVGKEISTQETLLALDGENALEAEFSLTDAQYGRLLSDDAPVIGRPIAIKWTVGNQVFNYEGAISRLGAEIKTDLGGVLVFATVNIQDAQQAIRPGAFVEIEVPDKSYAQSAVLPESAIYDGSIVYTIDDQGRLMPVNVTVAAFEKGMAIISSGLAGGETILTTRLTRITGRPVKVIGSEPAGEDALSAAPQRPSPETIAEIKAENKLSDQDWSALPRAERQKLIQASRKKEPQ